jgi:uncharacterized RDD family membrane protein YckC
MAAAGSRRPHLDHQPDARTCARRCPVIGGLFAYPPAVWEAAGVGTPQTGRSAAVDLLVRVGRIGATPVRLALAPAYLLARSQRAEGVLQQAEGVVRAGAENAAASAGSMLESEAERAVNFALASPLPEAVARSLVAQHVVERVVAELLASGDAERIVTSAIADERTDQLVQRVLASPTTQRLLVDVVDSRLTLELADRLMRSPDLQRVIADAVRAGVANQTATLADDIASSAHRLDGAVERGPRRWLRRPVRPQALDGRPAVPYAGVGSRLAALIVDTVAVQAVYLVGCAMVVLVIDLVRRSPSQAGAVGLASAGWVVLVVAYFVTFWAAVGQTPGMRVMRLRVRTASGDPLGLGRAFLRLAVSGVAVAFLLLGFLPVLVDGRRRALQDLVAGTIVVYDPRAAAVTSPTGITPD